MSHLEQIKSDARQTWQEIKSESRQTWQAIRRNEDLRFCLWCAGCGLLLIVAAGLVIATQFLP